MNRNCLSYWFPKLEAAGVPVPRTEIVRTAVDLTAVLDGQIPDGIDGFMADLRAAVARVGGGGPVFLRTGQGSGKHNWKRTCYLDPTGDAVQALASHVAALVEWSHLVDFFGLPHDVWCVRELLPTEPVTTLPRYGDMPLVQEVRAFVRDGRVVCSHNYWPVGAVRDGLTCPHRAKPATLAEALDSPTGGCPVCMGYAAGLVARLDCTPEDYLGWSPVALRVAGAFARDGAWSVDLLRAKRIWFVTDMAEAERSYHAPECPHAQHGGA